MAVHAACHSLDVQSRFPAHAAVTQIDTRRHPSDRGEPAAPTHVDRRPEAPRQVTAAAEARTRVQRELLRRAADVAHSPTPSRRNCLSGGPACAPPARSYVVLVLIFASGRLRAYSATFCRSIVAPSAANFSSMRS